MTRPPAVRTSSRVPGGVVEDAKQAITRKRRIDRALDELEQGMRRPCCWPGCPHRERTGR